MPAQPTLEDYVSLFLIYGDDDPATLRQFSDPANRHFMLCDLHDLIVLKGGLAVKRRLKQAAGP